MNNDDVCIPTRHVCFPYHITVTGTLLNAVQPLHYSYTNQQTKSGLKRPSTPPASPQHFHRPALLCREAWSYAQPRLRSSPQVLSLRSAQPIHVTQFSADPLLHRLAPCSSSQAPPRPPRPSPLRSSADLRASASQSPTAPVLLRRAQNHQRQTLLCSPQQLSAFTARSAPQPLHSLLFSRSSAISAPQPSSSPSRLHRLRLRNTPFAPKLDGL
jgi:hypothetical protein